MSAEQQSKSSCPYCYSPRPAAASGPCEICHDLIDVDEAYPELTECKIDLREAAIVLGAGFSYDFGMPVLADFGRVVQTLPTRIADSPHLRSLAGKLDETTLNEFVRRVRSGDVSFNLEEALLAAEVRDDRACIAFIKRVVLATLLPLNKAARRQCSQRIPLLDFEPLREQLSPLQTPTLSFNYDSIFESIVGIYPFGEDPRYFHGREESRGIVFKVHGNLEWYACSACCEYYPDDVGRIMAEAGDPELISDDDIYCCPECGECEVKRFILLPSRQPRPAVEENWIQRNLEAFRAKTLNRQNLVFIGYSFPPSDERYRRFFVELAQQDHIQNVVIINPSAMQGDFVRRVTAVFDGFVNKLRFSLDCGRFELGHSLKVDELARYRARMGTSVRMYEQIKASFGRQTLDQLVSSECLLYLRFASSAVDNQPLDIGLFLCAVANIGVGKCLRQLEEMGLTIDRLLPDGVYKYMGRFTPSISLGLPDDERLPVTHDLHIIMPWGRRYSVERGHGLMLTEDLIIAAFELCLRQRHVPHNDLNEPPFTTIGRILEDAKVDVLAEYCRMVASAERRFGESTAVYFVLRDILEADPGKAIRDKMLENLPTDKMKRLLASLDGKESR